MHRTACALVIAAALFVSSTLTSFATGKDLAVLVVGKATDASMAATEKGLIEQLTRLRVQKGWGHKVLPIFSYHFDKATERAYCEEKLKVKASDLLTVGIVELEGGVPVDYVYRENTVTSPATVADKIIDHAQSELASRGALPGAVATHPASTQTPSHPIAMHTTAPNVPIVTTTPKPLQSPKPLVHKWHPKVKKHAVAKKATAKKTVAVKHSAAKVVVVKHPDKVVVITHAAPLSPGAAKWAIQVGLFSSLEKARLMAHKCKEGHKMVEIRKVKQDSYRVLVGRFPNQGEAYTKAKQLQGTGVEAFSVRLEPKLGKLIH